jgi:hypothetical protein
MANDVERPIARRVAALLLVFALGSGGLIIAAASPTQAADPPAGAATITGGSVDWGIKSSFRSYITGPIAQGAISTADGTTTNVDGSYRFPNAAGPYDNGNFDATVDGSVRFTGHAGALDMTISAVRVEVDGTDAALHADVMSKSFDDATFETFTDVEFATLDLTGIDPSDTSGSFTWAAIPTTLTTDGATAFSDFYTAGTALDPVSVTLAFDEEPEPTSSSTSSSTPTTTETSTTVTSDPTDPPSEPSGERTAIGPTGQALTVKPADNLDPGGATVSVTGTGFDPSIGVYLAFCVDRGGSMPPTPCLGGVDMDGRSGASVWISSNPPPYGVGLAQPYGPGGTFAFDVNIKAVDTDDEGNVIADCLDGTTSCVIATRADHTNPAERSADVKVPVFFVGQEVVEPPATDSLAPQPTPDPPTPAGNATVLGSGTLPVTGTDTTRIGLIGLTLVGLGTGLTIAVRSTRAHRAPDAPVPVGVTPHGGAVSRGSAGKGSSRRRPGG